MERSKIALKSSTNQFLQNKHDASSLKYIMDSFKVSKAWNFEEKL